MLVGETDCEVENINNAAEEFDKVNCTINLERDSNYQCDVVVYRPLPHHRSSLVLSHKNCNKGKTVRHSGKDNRIGHEILTLIFSFNYV